MDDIGVLLKQKPGKKKAPLTTQNQYSGQNVCVYERRQKERDVRKKSKT